MTYEPPIVVYDACVLYPFHVRNILVQCAVEGLVRARWTDTIHDEWIKNLCNDRPDLTVALLARTRALMNELLPDASVTGFEDNISKVALPDPNDRHVVAAAIAAGAHAIVTWNLKDFPDVALAPFDLRAVDPDELLVTLFSAAPDIILFAAARARQNLRLSKPPSLEFIATIERHGMRQFAKILRGEAAKI